ncbi:MAG: hypothetical protein KGJ86_06760 [Chloroflexota bacterium]|nr:hypothetical protein [Chloroflexota bacterium]
MQLSLNVEVSNTGMAFSQSGNASATGLLGNAAVGSASAPAASAALGPPGAVAVPRVDLRSADYALADSGDAMAIGVKATTSITGSQRIVVIIDDNSSGNRIEITFHITVSNQGMARAISGAASAVGQRGDLVAGSAVTRSASLETSAKSSSGSASATGVDATTLVDALQSVFLEVGENSSNNRVDASFDVSVSNRGDATALTGNANAQGWVGNALTSEGGASQLNAGAGDVNTTNRATARSGSASSVGVSARTSLSERQTATVIRPSANGGAVIITQDDRVINVGLARSISGDVSVVAQLVPSPVPATSAVGAPTPFGNTGHAAADNSRPFAAPVPGNALELASVPSVRSVASASAPGSGTSAPNAGKAVCAGASGPGRNPCAGAAIARAPAAQEMPLDVRPGLPQFAQPWTDVSRPQGEPPPTKGRSGQVVAGGDGAPGWTPPSVYFVVMFLPGLLALLRSARRS